MTEALPIRRACDLDVRDEEHRWLIDGLWAEQAVGVVGGEPKSMKSYLALQCAVAVAAGKDALEGFSVNEPGPVLLYAAEDAPSVVRERLLGIAAAKGVELRDLDVFVITVDRLRLDLESDRQRLQAAVEVLRPRLLILDPFVRLHRVDENVAGDVAPILAYLRGLQRAYQTSVMLVHHAKKGASGARGGQALRGSSELHAWGDSNLYLKRTGSRVRLTVEQRAAPGNDGVLLELSDRDGAGPALFVVADTEQVDAPDATGHDTVEHKIDRILLAAAAPMTVRDLRDRIRVRTQTLCDALAALIDQGRIEKLKDGYVALRS